MQPRVILNSKQLELTINRLCYQLIENHNNFSESVLIGLQPRGIFVAQRIKARLEELGISNVLSGNLDITFYRDDFRRREEPLSAQTTDIDFIIEDKKVILLDDVLYTGRTIRAGLDALMDFGRPKSVELLVLIDRRFSRHLPIEPNYTGRTVDSIASEKVKVEWDSINEQNQVILYTSKEIDE